LLFEMRNSLKLISSKAGNNGGGCHKENFSMQSLENRCAA
jgi:hypothetical protein